MDCYHFQLISYSSHKKRIIVPKHVYPTFKPNMKLIYCLNETDVEVMTHQKDEDTLYISDLLLNEIKFPESPTISFFMENNHLLIQPLLGVYTAGFQEDAKMPIGERTPVFESMAITGQSYGFDTVFFGYQHINWEDKTIDGYTFQEGDWVKKVFPFPYVIYDRIPNRKVEHHPSVLKAKERLEESTIWFNSGFFNKWQIYDKLRKTNQVSHLLPSTTLHPTKDKCKELIATHNSVFIKPIHGSKGNGIKKISFNKKMGILECTFYDQDKKIFQRYRNLDTLLEQQFPNGLHGYIAQPEILLKSKRTTPMDYRVHANKNEKNEWEVTAVCTKFAGKGSLTTHVKRGGSLHTLGELYDEQESHQVYQKLERSALLLSSTLEKSTSGPLGEIGFDFGIDEEGKVWLFEANSKPGYALYDHPTFKKEQSVILSYPYRYAKYFYFQLLYQ